MSDLPRTPAFNTSMTPSTWLCASRPLALDRPRLMAIMNLTPDSFSDGGTLTSIDDALRRAEQAQINGADILDLGGESTRPGAPRISVDEQIRRVIPALAVIRKRLPDIPISIDTTLSAVARAALDEGADAINDVSAGVEDPLILDLAAQRQAGVILMHRLVPPGGDVFSHQYTREPDYSQHGGVVSAVTTFLTDRVAAAQQAGCRRESILIDPGLGFGKSVEQNAELIRRVDELGRPIGLPVLSALSRKSFVAHFSAAVDATGRPLPGAHPDRLPGTLALSVAMLQRGCRVFRVHDVREHRLALDAAWGVTRARSNAS